MKIHKNTDYIFAILGLVLCVIAGLFVYIEYSLIGFPTGYYTAFDRFAKDVFFPVAMGVNLLFFVGFVLMLFQKKKTKMSFFIYLFIVVLSYLIYYYLSINMENGQGG